MPENLERTSEVVTKLRLAFVDHSFHEKSRATGFLIDLLAEDFDVRVCWDHSWAGGRGVGADELNGLAPDAVVLFQLIRTPEFLKLLRCRNITLVPMYDEAAWIEPREWLSYRKYRFLNFSSTLADRHERLGLRSLMVRYYRRPEQERTRFDGLRGFFWQRRSEVTWEHVRRLIEGTHFESFHLHLAVDPPGYPVVEPSAEDRRRFNMTVSRWSENGEEYRRHLARANVFFAPRIVEGIGQSFLEAMSAGMVVVAPDRPTMNEYISNGVNGILYDFRRLEPLDFSGADRLGRAAWESAGEGFDRWTREMRAIRAYVAGSASPFRVGGLDALERTLRRAAYLVPASIENGGRVFLNGFRRPYRELPFRVGRALRRVAGRVASRWS